MKKNHKKTQFFVFGNPSLYFLKIPLKTQNFLLQKCTDKSPHTFLYFEIKIYCLIIPSNL